jgi:hypothetical protein
MLSKKFIRGALSPLAIIAVVGVLAACGTKDQQPESRQVELTPAPAAQPQLGDTANAATTTTTTTTKTPAPAKKPVATVPAPKAATPAPAPAPARASTGIVAGGTTMSTALGTRVCTNTHKVGDRVTATLGNDVTGSNGARIPAGATVTMRVSESQRGENGKEGIRLGFEPVSVSFGGNTYAINGSAVMTQMETIRAQSTGDQAKKVAAGAVIGAIAGQIIGKRAKTAAIGAAVGAGAGAAVASGSADWNACLGEGATLTITLASPVTVKVGAGSGL